MDGLLERLQRQQAAPARALGVPQGQGVGALINPTATIDEVSPLEFKPGERIDLDVKYTPANYEESMWQTVVNVMKDTTKLVQERQKHLSMTPGQISADCDTGMTMPNEPVTFIIEVWGHPDYGESTWPDC